MSDCDYYPRVRAKWKTLNYEVRAPRTDACWLDSR